MIEHLEEYLSKWVLAEYRNARRIVGGRLVITNAGRCCDELRAVASCYSESIAELEGILYSSQDRLIVLDPQAEKPLEPSEARNAEAIVVGGILGDHPPRGRTRKLLSSKLPRALKRHLGPYQLSIDGAVYVASKIIEGRTLNEIPLKLNPRIEIDMGEYGTVEVELPFAYPIVDGKPLIAAELLEHLTAGLGLEELRVARGTLKKCF